MGNCMKEATCHSLSSHISAWRRTIWRKFKKGLRLTGNPTRKRRGVKEKFNLRPRQHVRAVSVYLPIGIVASPVQFGLKIFRKLVFYGLSLLFDAIFKCDACFCDFTSQKKKNRE